MKTKLHDYEFQSTLAPVDHRKAEIALNRYFDKVPKMHGDMSDDT